MGVLEDGSLHNKRAIKNNCDDIENYLHLEFFLMASNGTRWAWNNPK